MDLTKLYALLVLEFLLNTLKADVQYICTLILA